MQIQNQTYTLVWLLVVLLSLLLLLLFLCFRLYANYMSKNKNPAEPKFTADNFHQEVEVAVNEFKECLRINAGSARACSYIGPVSIV